MSTYQYSAGDRVKVEFEGVVAAHMGQHILRVKIPGASPMEYAYVTAEHLTLIEPEYPVGSLWMDADGAVIKRTDNPDRPWCHPLNERRTYSDQYATPPLTRLYREDEIETLRGAE